MYKILPHITEKSVKIAKKGYFTLKVPKSWTKTKIKEAVSRLFKVTVFSVCVINRAPRYESKLKKKIKIKEMKKAIVKIDKNQVISGFETFLEEKKDKKVKEKIKQ